MQHTEWRVLLLLLLLLLLLQKHSQQLLPTRPTLTIHIHRLRAVQLQVRSDVTCRLGAEEDEDEVVAEKQKAGYVEAVGPGGNEAGVGFGAAHVVEAEQRDAAACCMVAIMMTVKITIITTNTGSSSSSSTIAVPLHIAIATKTSCRDVVAISRTKRLWRRRQQTKVLDGVPEFGPHVSQSAFAWNIARENVECVVAAAVARRVHEEFDELVCIVISSRCCIVGSARHQRLQGRQFRKERDNGVTQEVLRHAADWRRVWRCQQPGVVM